MRFSTLGIPSLFPVGGFCDFRLLPFDVAVAVAVAVAAASGLRLLPGG